MKILAPIRSVRHQFENKSLKEKLLFIVSLSGSPEHLALSFAIGIFIGLCPLYGLHTFAAFLAVYLFRLNLPTMILGAWLNLPFIAPAVYFLCFELGRRLTFGSSQTSDAVISATIEKILQLNFSEIALQKADAIYIIRTLFIGSTVAGLILAIIGYYSLKQAIVLHRRRTASAAGIGQE